MSRLKNSLKTPLLDALNAQVQRQRHRFHVPFHAGSALTDLHQTLMDNGYAYDFTELPDLDVLGNPTGVIQASQTAVADLFGSQQTYYLINGASVGIMAAILASGLSEPREEVLVARNCHRSVLHGLILMGCTPRWILPKAHEAWGLWGEISPDTLEETLKKYPNIALFAMTHPTYEGIGSDIHAIHQVCQQYGVKLIVDEAHGSLFPLLASLPTSAIEVGADAVIHSLHKTGGSLTQTALLHLPKDSAFDPQHVQQALNILQTTSPSYLLLANIEATCLYLASEEAQSQIADKLSHIQDLKTWIQSTLQTIEVLLCPDNQSPFHLFLRSTKLLGEALAFELEEVYDLAYEAATPYGVLLLMNLGQEEIALEALQAALHQIENKTRDWPDVQTPQVDFTLPEMMLSPQKAFHAPGETLSAKASVGRVAKHMVAACPPGIPVLIPGEKIAAHHVPFLPSTVEVVA